MVSNHLRLDNASMVFPSKGALRMRDDEASLVSPEVLDAAPKFDTSIHG